LVDLKDAKYKRKRIVLAKALLDELGVTPEDIATLATPKSIEISPAKMMAAFPGYRDQERGRKLFRAAVGSAAVASEYAVRKFKKSLPHNEWRIVFEFDGFVKQFGIEHLPKGFPDDYPFAVCLVDVIGRIEAEFKSLEDVPNAPEDLKDKIVFIGDYGQSTFSFGFFLPARNRSRESFIPLMFSRGIGCSSRKTFMTLGAEVIRKVNEFLLRHPGAAFLGGDWEWLNSINGLMGCSAVYSCPLCEAVMTVDDENNARAVAAHPNAERGVRRNRSLRVHTEDVNWLHRHQHACLRGNSDPVEIDKWRRTKAGRDAIDRTHSAIEAPIFPKLFESVVPLPLHVFLGLCNDFLHTLHSYLSEEKKEEFKEKTRAVEHRPTGVNGGEKPSSFKDWNGREIQSMLKPQRGENGNPQGESFLVAFCDSIVAPARRSKITGKFRICKHLAKLLLSPRQFTSRKKDKLQAIAMKAQEVWKRDEGKRMIGRIKPKAHMLFHCAAFAVKNDYLGSFSEAPIESHHAELRRVWEKYGAKGKSFMEKMLYTAQQIGMRRSVTVRNRKEKMEEKSNSQ
jgi:hypothetical protein